MARYAAALLLAALPPLRHPLAVAITAPSPPQWTPSQLGATPISMPSTWRSTTCSSMRSASRATASSSLPLRTSPLPSGGFSLAVACSRLGHLEVGLPPRRCPLLAPTVGTMCCCIHSMAMAPILANMCVGCLCSSVDITEGLPRHDAVVHYSGPAPPPASFFPAHRRHPRPLFLHYSRAQELSP